MPQNRNVWKRINWNSVSSLDKKRLATTCLQCGAVLQRKFYGIKEYRRYDKIYTYAHWETTSRFLKRKFCSTDCVHKYQVLEKNPNYRGKLPHCLDCGKQLYTYDNTNKGSPIAKRCKNCYWKFFKKVGLSEKQKETLRKNAFYKGMPPTKGAWLKGHKPWNKSQFNNCQVENCNNNFLAKGMCANHYQSWKRKKDRKCIVCNISLWDKKNAMITCSVKCRKLRKAQTSLDWRLKQQVLNF